MPVEEACRIIAAIAPGGLLALRRRPRPEPGDANDTPAGRQPAPAANDTRAPGAGPIASRSRDVLVARCRLPAGAWLGPPARRAREQASKTVRVLRALRTLLTSSSACRGGWVSVEMTATGDRRPSRGHGCRDRSRCFETMHGRARWPGRHHPGWYCPFALRRVRKCRRDGHNAGRNDMWPLPLHIQVSQESPK
jgi:hypothetical protein